MTFKTNIGLKQGCKLSPLLANIVFCDLHAVLEKERFDAPKLNQYNTT